MPTLRCSSCGINYPVHFQCRKCKVCGEATNEFSDDAPDTDWQKKVELAQKDMAVYIPEDKSNQVQVDIWREEELIAAGFSEGSAAELAANVTIDLHKACELARAAGPEIAYRILV